MLEEDKVEGINSSHITLQHETKIRISRNEYLLLTHLRSLERVTIECLAKSMSLSKPRIVKLIDHLREKVIINKFQAVFDSNMLGYKCYMFFIKFTSCEVKDRFEAYSKDLRIVSHINTLNAGNWDIDVEIHVERADQCFSFWTDLENKFGNYIVNHTCPK